VNWPISFRDVLEARLRIAPYLPITPLRGYPVLDRELGMSVLIKHENHQPTGAFKARNALSVLTRLTAEERARGVVAATRGNHGQALAWAGALLGVRVTICVPLGNNPEKNEATRGFGAELIEQGRDYDEAVAVAATLVAERGMRLVHSSNEALVVAGAATMTLEILEQAPHIDALVVSVGGGSQAVGALTVARALRPDLPVYAVQAAAASAIHDSWRSGQIVVKESANTFADGLATRQPYPFTFPALRTGLTDFVLASEPELADAVRLALRTTHQLVEGAGAAPLAALPKLRERLAGRTVAIVFSGGNIDAATLTEITTGRL
jgi:threonine dehydratase